ncbi:hypothetical protein ERO13_A07G088300v2 [Gossypium hirsutum]|uniref:Uncharacterized protein LOC107933998 isoform X1 n=1 Tax=Gossypium hirsutum TaxID=3635 RepID=A0A1U8M4S4_GOSHI|nr:uncharacterized protein LOC107933998 isoform X1 [Gossypium hirsutum]XP_016721812.1 uncharacterized protein LOC107933998 isoform X1 [Gossypium hirsutum]KAG4191362.1 hypothetical protein ERO13_A07G088300v2 [Gossypium hirsutum]KAG4191363.1 hypothetical protein ERO13_A07G088300v2 [Gossypium hirsutum]KAG4191364.1 hypothetical protein ERO13_A07G088300v2 [Gossypium hirsutum]
MGRKVGVVKSGIRNSIPSSNPSTVSLPLRCQHEADGDRHVDGKNHGAYDDNGSGQDKDNNSSGDANADADGMGNGNVNGHARVDVDDKVNDRDEEKGDDDVARCVRGKHADCIVVDWLNGEYCFECNSGSGQVLVCSEKGCPVALHEACMTWRPIFDDMGKFYCPYCLYKKEVARFKDLTTEAMLARNELSNFICLRRDSRNKEREGETLSMKGASVSTMATEVSCGDCRNGLNDDGKETRHHSQDETRGVDVIRKEQSNEQNISRAHGFENVRNGEMMEEVEEDSSDSGGDDIGEGQQQKRPSSSSGVRTVEETQGVASIRKEKSDEQNLPMANGFENVGNRERMEEDIEISSDNGNAEIGDDRQQLRPSSSKVPVIESFEFVSPNLDTETLVTHQKRDKQRANKAQPLKVVSSEKSSLQPSTSAKNMNVNQERNTVAVKISEEGAKSTKRPLLPVLGTEKRRRLHWTAEEEDMLKELVHKFSSQVNKNIPWRKILEHGRPVFHSTRIPVDLKDKWKNIVAKEISKG